MTEDLFRLYDSQLQAGKSQNVQLGRNTFVEQEAKAVTLAIKSREDALQIVKKKSLLNMVLPRFHILFDRPIGTMF